MYFYILKGAAQNYLHFLLNDYRGYGQNTLGSTGFGTEQFSTGEYSDPGRPAAPKAGNIKDDRDAYRVAPVQQPVPPLHLVSHDEDTMPSRTPRTPGVCFCKNS